MASFEITERHRAATNVPKSESAMEPTSDGIGRLLSGSLPPLPLLVVSFLAAMVVISILHLTSLFVASHCYNNNFL